MDKWEIAVLDENGEFITQEVWNDTYDDVIGWVSDSNLTKYVKDVELHVGGI